jgi:hypothetical protein
LADHIAEALDLDMTLHWTPDLAFWSRLPKAALIAELEGAPCMQQLNDADRASCIKSASKRRKEDLVTLVAQSLEGSGWLPALLVTAEQTRP